MVPRCFNFLGILQVVVCHSLSSKRKESDRMIIFPHFKSWQFSICFLTLLDTSLALMGEGQSVIERDRYGDSQRHKETETEVRRVQNRGLKE